MEFLMTYGWAIIVVLVVIAALAYFGVLSPAKLLPGKCQFQIGILCKDFTASGDELEIGGVTVEGVYPIFFDLVNRMGEPIYVTKINVSSRSGLECMQIQIEECTAEQRSFIEPLFGPAGTTFDSFADCISVQEACDNIGCGAIEPNRMLRWSDGETFRVVLGTISSEHLPLLCRNMPKKGQKTDALITVEYFKTDPSLTHVAYGELDTTVT